MDRYRISLSSGRILSVAPIKFVARLFGGFYAGYLKKEVLLWRYDTASDRYIYIERIVR